MRSRNGNIAAEGFQTSWKISAARDWHISAMPIDTANINTRPPRRRASITQPTMQSVLTTPIAIAALAGPPSRTGIASSQ